jgi:chromosome segregation ATPase
MSKKEKLQQRIEKLKNEIEEEKKRHSDEMKKIEKQKTDELEKIKNDNAKKIKDLEEQHSKTSLEWEEKLKEVKDIGEKQKIKLKEDKKNKFEEDKNKIKEDLKKKKSEIKEKKIEKEDLEPSINKEKEEIQKLMNENQKLLFEARQNQNEINFYEMNFGQLFFSDELKNQIQAESEKYKAEYENMARDKFQLFNQYKNDQELTNFLSLAQTNPIMHNYLIPQIYNEFYAQPYYQ